MKKLPKYGWKKITNTFTPVEYELYRLVYTHDKRLKRTHVAMRIWKEAKLNENQKELYPDGIQEWTHISTMTPEEKQKYILEARMYKLTGNPAFLSGAEDEEN